MVSKHPRSDSDPPIGSGRKGVLQNNSYKGYSPPKCICNAISHIQVKTYAFLLKCLHAMDENVTHPVPCPESSPTPSHMHMPSVKTVIGVSPNDLTHWTTLQYLFNFIKSRVFLWVVNFRGLTAGFTHLPRLSRNFIVGYICLTKNKIWVFHPGWGGGGGGGGGGDLPHLTSPKHT